MVATYNGTASDGCVTECAECGQDFTCTATWDVEHHDGYGTRCELFPDEDTCRACKGEGKCEGTFTSDAAGRYVPVECASREGRTRRCIEDDGSRSHLGVYCDACAKFYAEDE